MIEPALRSTVRMAGALGRGVLAGLAATAAMSLSTSIEMRLSGREPSNTPVAAAGKTLGVQPRNQTGAKRFGTLVHWGYGTGWGAVGGLLHHGVSEPSASAAHFGLVWGTEVTLLPAMDVIPPLPEWPPGEVAMDVWHHIVYVAAFAAVWAVLERYAQPVTATDRLIARLGDASSWVRKRLAS